MTSTIGDARSHVNRNTTWAKDKLFTNLTLLGINNFKCDQSVSISRTMFDSINFAGVNVVLYFLFKKYDVQLCNSKLRDCWPVYDRKQQHLFRLAIGEWIIQLKHPLLPKNIKFLLLSPVGDKFALMLHRLSSIVIEKLLGKSDCLLGRPSSKDKSVMAVRETAFKFNILREQQTFQVYMKRKMGTEKQDHHYMQQLQQIIDHQKLTEAKLTDELQSTSSTATFDEGHCLRWENFITQWSKYLRLQSSFFELQRLFDCLQSQEKRCLRAEDITFELPKILMRTHESERISLFDNGLLNISKLLDVTNDSLALYSQSITKGPFALSVSELKSTIHRQRVSSEVLSSIREVSAEKIENYRRSISLSLEVMRPRFSDQLQPLPSLAICTTDTPADVKSVAGLSSFSGAPVRVVTDSSSDISSQEIPLCRLKKCALEPPLQKASRCCDLTIVSNSMLRIPSPVSKVFEDSFSSFLAGSEQADILSSTPNPTEMGHISSYDDSTLSELAENNAQKAALEVFTCKSKVSHSSLEQRGTKLGLSSIAGDTAAGSAGGGRPISKIISDYQKLKQRIVSTNVQSVALDGALHISSNATDHSNDENVQQSSPISTTTIQQVDVSNDSDLWNLDEFSLIDGSFSFSSVHSAH